MVQITYFSGEFSSHRRKFTLFQDLASFVIWIKLNIPSTFLMASNDFLGLPHFPGSSSYYVCGGNVL